jgi:hypothetical protein
VLSVVHLTPGVNEGAWFIWLWWFYLAVALRAVFGGRLWPQIVRALALLSMHGTLLAIAMALVAVLVLPTLS